MTRGRLDGRAVYPRSGWWRTAWALLVALLTVSAAGTARAQDAGAIVGRASKVYQGLSSLKADFVQVIDNPMIDSAESRGTLVQAGQDKLAMRFTDPPGEAIVIDGEHVWLYTPSTTPGQVIRLSVPSGGPVYGYNMLAWFLDKPAERYTATYLRRDKLNGRAVDVVQLVPAVSDLPFGGHGRVLPTDAVVRCTTATMPCPAGSRSPSAPARSARSHCRMCA